MNESEMGNRGSKSITSIVNADNVIVKEQRVDGSWVTSNNNIRLKKFMLT